MTNVHYERLDFASRDHEMVSPPWYRLLRDIYYEDHVPFNVNEGHRTFERQQELVDEKGVWSPSNPTGAARPSANAPHIRTGRVDHANDLDNATGVIAAAAKRGVTIRQTILPSEPWHVEADAAELIAYAKKDRRQERQAARDDAKAAIQAGTATGEHAHALPFHAPAVSPAAKVAQAHGLGFAEIVVEEAHGTDIPISLAFAMVEQESGGRNVYGHDPVQNPAIKGGPVTEANYAVYKQARRNGQGMQGVGPMQLTWWATQDKADAAGGCWKPRINIRVGFETLRANIAAHGEFGGVAAYNGTGDAAEYYARSVLSKRDLWAQRVKGVK